jgi:hypothetical protein
LIGGSSIAVWIVQNRYQQEIERAWQNRNGAEKYYQIHTEHLENKIFGKHKK